MKIRHGEELLVTACSGCPCHWNDAIQMGDLHDGCCSECGCPKTTEAFNRLLEKAKTVVGDENAVSPNATLA